MRWLDRSALKFVWRILAGAILVSSLGAQAASAQDGFKLLELDGHVLKWGAARFQQGASLTYAVLGAPTTMSGITNCRRLQPVAALLTGSAVSRRDFDRELAAALAMWEAVADLNFKRVASARAANVVVAAQSVPDGVAYADVTPAPGRDKHIAPISKGIVCLNPALRWSATGAAPAGSYRFRDVLAHEIGHVLGLDHPSPRGELMSFEYDAALDGLQPGDVAGIVALYGKRAAAARVALNAGNAAAP